MKQFSSNIEVTAGWAVVIGLNAFPKGDCTFDGFKACMKEIAATAEKVAPREINEDYWDDLTHPMLAAMSLPRFRKEGEREYRMTSPFFNLGSIIFKHNAVIKFDENGDCISELSDRVVMGTTLVASLEETTYDTYNGKDLDGINKETIEALDIGEEYTNAAELINPEWAIAVVKVLSIYVPEVSNQVGEVWAGYEMFDEANDYDTNRNKFSGEEQFDFFAIKFIDKEKPFAYVNIESLENEEADQMDLNSDAFDSSNREIFLASDYNVPDEDLVQIYLNL